jgi:endonuclease YncB( thermonuclease family)
LVAPPAEAGSELSGTAADGASPVPATEARPATDAGRTAVTGEATVISATQLILAGRAIRLYGLMDPPTPQNLKPYQDFIARVGLISCRGIAAQGAYICTDSQQRDLAALVVKNGLADSLAPRYQTAKLLAKTHKVGMWRTP